LIDMAGVQTGMRVLDLACGAGSQSIQLAKRVGPNGTVVASDISATMLDHVRRNALRMGLKNIETLECAAESLDERQPLFDASISRLDLMLFPSPQAALAAVRRVLRPGARVAALVFTTPASNPFMAQTMSILLRHAGKSSPAPGKPGIFALGGPGALEKLMKDCGLVEVRSRNVQALLKLPSASDALAMMQEAFGAYRAVVAELNDARKSEAWREVQTCLQQFETGDGFRTDFDFVVASGANPG
jgi:cyclopropane fatty-acyl-phospholipid synthase-like methyltransferase